MSYRPTPHQAPRPRVSHRRYQLRRAIAAGVVLIVLLGGWSIVSSWLGDDSPAEIEASSPSTSLVESNGSTPITSPASTSTTSPPKEEFVPSPEHQAVLYIAGDSDAGAFAPYLTGLMKDTGVVETHTDYKNSTGLSRPDFFNWPEHLNESIPQVSPDIVVVTFGGNDAQGLAVESGEFIVNQAKGDGSEIDQQWSDEYGRRVGAVMDFLTAGNRTLIWVGIPNAKNDSDTARLKVQDQVVRAEVAKRPGVVYIDTWKRFSGQNGGYASFVIDPRDGQGKDVRQGDDFHLNTTGAEILSLDIAEAIKTELRNRGAQI